MEGQCLFMCSVVLGIESGASHVLASSITTEFHPQPLKSFLIKLKQNPCGLQQAWFPTRKDLKALGNKRAQRLTPVIPSLRTLRKRIES